MALHMHEDGMAVVRRFCNIHSLDLLAVRTPIGLPDKRQIIVSFGIFILLKREELPTRRRKEATDVGIDIGQSKHEPRHP